MPTPAKNTATIISIAMPFCGDLELTPHSCLSKSSWSRLVILEISSWQEMTDCGQRAPGVPRSLKQGLFQSRPFKNYFWRKPDRDR
jgi:hypothetical protein